MRRRILLNAGSEIFTKDDQSEIDIDAGTMVLAGAIYAGCRIGWNHQTWLGKNASLDLDVAENLVLGGYGVDDTGELVRRGAAIRASGAIDIAVAGHQNDVSVSLSAWTALLPSLWMGR